MLRSPRPIQSVDRAILILDVLAGEPNGLSLRDLSVRLFLAPQTVQSLLRTLELRELVVQGGRGAPYRIGPGLHRLAGDRPSRDERGSLARNPVANLAKDVGESVLLAELSGRRAAPLAQARFEHPLAVTPDSEGFQRLHTMATGKVLLAAMPVAARTVFVHSLNLTARTPVTVTDADQLLEQLAVAAKQGWAETIEEAVLGIAALAVPIPTTPDQVPAALGICLPTARYSPERRPELLAALRRSAQEIQDIWLEMTDAGAG